MAPRQVEKKVEWQTDLIIQFLLEDEHEVKLRSHHSEIETDGPGDNFDPVLIADKLRTIGDAMSDDINFQSALKDLKQAASQEVVDQAFSYCVEAVCKTHAAKGAEMAPEMQLIQASVALGLYVKKSAPEIKVKIQHALTSFLNRHVGSWVAQQGGWERVPDVQK